VRNATWRAGAGIVLATALLAGCQWIPIPGRSEGERLWRARCSECHAYDGSGNTPKYMGDYKADLLDDSWQHGGDPGSWGVVIREGIFGSMPANHDLTREQVDALVHHLRRLRHEELPEGRR
jgi:mono/diheme cytochrome c family protein